MKTITISSFKAHISAELKRVRQGARLVISDRDTPIAEVVPYRNESAPTIVVLPPRSTPFVLPSPTLDIAHDPLEYLLEDRDSR